LIKNLKTEVIQPVIVKGLPKSADLKALDIMAGTIAKKHKEIIK
jgi:hypothetical protein